jgi:hypothetical protein
MKLVPLDSAYYNLILMCIEVIRLPCKAVQKFYKQFFVAYVFCMLTKMSISFYTIVLPCVDSRIGCVPFSWIYSFYVI